MNYSGEQTSFSMMESVVCWKDRGNFPNSMQKWLKQDGRFLSFSEAIKNEPTTDSRYIQNA